MQADGSQQTDLMNEPAEDTHAAWSPEGDIYVINVDGTGLTRLTSSPGS